MTIMRSTRRGTNVSRAIVSSGIRTNFVVHWKVMSWRKQAGGSLAVYVVYSRISENPPKTRDNVTTPSSYMSAQVSMDWAAP